jgi:DNA-binding winged helix-turn-helix (wHTH) protein/tetratricopeptide (TPR) repeat protein
MESTRPEIFRFAGYELDVANCELRRNGSVIKLPPQPFKVLALLASRPNELVTRDELRRAVWGDELVVDFEHGLNTCIRQIRTAVGDEAVTARIIETVPRRGYRFKAPLTRTTKLSRRVPWRTVIIATAVLACAYLVFLQTTPAIHTWSASARRSHDLYVRGTVVSERLMKGDARRALQLYQEAASLDPQNALAHAGIARAYGELTFSGALPGRLAYPNAAQAAARALSLDNRLAEAHLAAASVKYRFEWNWREAEHEFRRAIEIEPDSSVAHEEYATLLSLEGRFHEALKEIRLAESLAATSPRVSWMVAVVFYYGRRYDEAVAQARRTLEMDPNYGWAWHTIAQCLQAQGKFNEAIEMYLRGGTPNPGNLGHAYAQAGRYEEARQLLTKLESEIPSTGRAGNVAMIYTGLGDFDRAFAWLDRAYEERAWLGALKVAPAWDPLRPDPRFATLLRRVGLADLPRDP